MPERMVSLRSFGIAEAHKHSGTVDDDNNACVCVLLYCHRRFVVGAIFVISVDGQLTAKDV